MNFLRKSARELEAYHFDTLDNDNVGELATTENVQGAFMRSPFQEGFLNHVLYGANPYNSFVFSQGSAGHLYGGPYANTAYYAEVPSYPQATFPHLPQPDTTVMSTGYDQPEATQWSTDPRREVTTYEYQFSMTYALTATFGATDAEELIKHFTGQITTSVQDPSSSTSSSPADSFREQQTYVNAQTEYHFGRIIEQHLSKPTHGSAYTRNVVKARLQLPLWFRRVDGRHGVPLQTLLCAPPSLSHVLLDASKAVNLESTTKNIAIHVQGEAEFKRQIRVKKEIFTLANFAKQTALIVKKMLDAQDKEARGNNALKCEVIIILGCVNVSTGCWQVILSECPE